MDTEQIDAWPPEWFIVPWRAVDVARDDQTITVHFGGDFDEDELTPRVTAEASRAEVVVRLQLIPTEGSGGGFFVMTGGDDDHTANVVLDEPRAGRPIVDAWKPPLPPPVPESLPIDAVIDDVAGHRTVYLDSIDVYDDSLSVNYRLRPGERDDDEAVHLMWDLEVEDDVGTEYDVPSGAYGGMQIRSGATETCVPPLRRTRAPSRSSSTTSGTPATASSADASLSRSRERP